VLIYKNAFRFVVEPFLIAIYPKNIFCPLNMAVKIDLAKRCNLSSFIVYEICNFKDSDSSETNKKILTLKHGSRWDISE